MVTTTKHAKTPCADVLQCWFLIDQEAKSKSPMRKGPSWPLMAWQHGSAARLHVSLGVGQKNFSIDGWFVHGHFKKNKGPGGPVEFFLDLPSKSIEK